MIPYVFSPSTPWKTSGFSGGQALWHVRQTPRFSLLGALDSCAGSQHHWLDGLFSCKLWRRSWQRALWIEDWESSQLEAGWNSLIRGMSQLGDSYTSRMNHLYSTWEDLPSIQFCCLGPFHLQLFRHGVLNSESHTFGFWVICWICHVKENGDLMVHLG